MTCRADTAALTCVGVLIGAEVNASVRPRVVDVIRAVHLHSAETTCTSRLVPVWLAIVFFHSPARQSHDIRSHSLVHDRTLPGNERVHNAIVDKHVSKRYLKVIEAVENERVVCRSRGALKVHDERSSSASSNFVVQH